MGTERHSFFLSSIVPPCKHTDIGHGVTDWELRVLASAGCGLNRETLDLSRASPPISLLFFLFWFLTIIPTQETRASAATIRRSAGSPHGLRRNNLQEVHRLWELRREQFLFFQENVDKAMAAHVWDEQHRLLSHSFLRYLFLSWSVLLFCHVRSKKDEMLNPLVFT